MGAAVGHSLLIRAVEKCMCGERFLRSALRSSLEAEARLRLIKHAYRWLQKRCDILNFFADEMDHDMAILLLNDLYVTTLSEAVQRAAYDVVSSFVCFPSAPLVRAADSPVEIAFC